MKSFYKIKNGFDGIFAALVGVLLLAACASSAKAQLTINPVYDPSFTGNANAGAIKLAIQTAIDNVEVDIATAGDYGDWGSGDIPADLAPTTPQQVQGSTSQFGPSPGLSQTELTALDVVGWNLTPAALNAEGDTTTLILGVQTSDSNIYNTYNLTSGILTKTAEYVGYANSKANGDTADFDQIGGINGTADNPIGDIDVGVEPGSVGTYELITTTSALIVANDEVIGDSGTWTSSSNSV